jgi:hypothetical protein
MGHVVSQNYVVCILSLERVAKTRQSRDRTIVDPVLNVLTSSLDLSLRTLSSRHVSLKAHQSRLPESTLLAIFTYISSTSSKASTIHQGF